MKSVDENVVFNDLTEGWRLQVVNNLFAGVQDLLWYGLNECIADVTSTVKYYCYFYFIFLFFIFFGGNNSYAK